MLSVWAPGLVNAQVVIHIPGRLSLDELTTYVHRHTAVRFSFNAGKVDGSRVIPLEQKVYSLEELLRQIHRATGLCYVVFGKHVIFQKRPPRTSFQGPSLTMDTSALPELARSFQPTAAIKRRILPQSAMRSPAARDKGGSSFFSKTYIQPGVSASDVLYCCPSLELGYAWLSIHAGWSTDFRRTHAVNGGIGIRLLQKERTQIQLLADFSPIKAIIWIDSSILGSLYVVQGDLYTLSGLWSYRLLGPLTLKAGLTANLLTTRYWYDGRPAPPGRVLTPGNPDKQLGLLDIPLLLFNTYKGANSSNVKGWIGLSVGIYYTVLTDASPKANKYLSI